MSLNDQDPSVVHRSKKSGTWTRTTLPIDGSQLCLGSGLALEITTGDRPHLAYCFETASGRYDVRYATRVAGTWSTFPVETAIGDKTPVELALDGEGVPHVVYRHAGSDALTYASYDF